MFDGMTHAVVKDTLLYALSVFYQNYCILDIKLMVFKHYVNFLIAQNLTYAQGQLVFILKIYA